MSDVRKNIIARAIGDFKKVVLGTSQGPIQGPLRTEPRDIPSEKEQQKEPVTFEQPPMQNENLSVEKQTALSIPEGQIENIHYPKVNARVFIVGVDNEVNSTIRAFLEKMGAQVLAGCLEPNLHKSILVQFPSYDNQIDFAIVVLSADEFSLQKKQDSVDAMLVSSQKTIFELGFLVGKLGRNRVTVFYQDIERFKRPTEFFDLLYVLFNDQNFWQEQLIHQMKASGLDVTQEPTFA